ncbi:FCD domain-containing protein [Gordonia sp. CPCC 205515]|uniref:FadR/GntR family transcriptional regulator n=1 Tax=Gordonia sp. CPCC 205515 TaxID=3140791 RepID=UPI003AF3A176
MPDLITPPPRTSELVVNRMQELIRSDEWPVGSRIPAEPDLVKQFGVGRNTIREAVRALEHAGMLAPRRGDGTYVRSRSLLAAAMVRSAPRSDRQDLLEVRRGLETEAVAAAALRATPDQVAELRGLLDAAETALAAGDLDAYTAADIAFHSALVGTSGNELLIELYGSVVEVMHRMFTEILRPIVADGAHPAGHGEVVEAIAAGDAAAARAAVASYLEHVPGVVA